MIAENVRKLDDCKSELNNIISWINKNPIHSNVRYLVSYAVVKSSGTIESVFKSMLYEYLADGTAPSTQAYLTKMIVDSSCNPSTGNIFRMLEQIDGELKEGFEDLIKGIQQKADLNSLVNLRNDVAHGRVISVTIATVNNYFDSGRYILELLEQILCSYA